MEPQFKRIFEESELQTLRDRLVKYFPNSIQMFNLVRLKLLKRFPESSQIDIHLYEDPQEEDETSHPFVVCTQKPNLQALHGVIVVAPETNITPRMLETFDKFIDWDNVSLFSNGNVSFTRHLKILTDKHGNKTKHPEGIPAAAFYLDVEAALNLPDYVPSDTKGANVEVKKLSVEDSDEMIRNWKWGLSHSKKIIEGCIKSMDSAGVYVDSNLASSAVLSPLGLFNVLYTDENYRRRGFGEVTLRALSKSVASMGLIPGAEAEMWNDKSMGLLRKVGFKYAVDVEWIYFEK